MSLPIHDSEGLGSDAPPPGEITVMTTLTDVVETRVDANSVGLSLRVLRSAERLAMGLFEDDRQFAWLNFERASHRFIGGVDGQRLLPKELGAWTMADAPLAEEGSVDVFDRFASLVPNLWNGSVAQRLSNWDCDFYGPFHGELRPPASWRKRYMAAIREVLRDEQRRLKSRLDKELLAYVERFHPHWRFRALARLRIDTTGRIRQLADCQPGAFLLGLYLDSEFDDWGDAYFDLVAAGEPLNRLITYGLKHVIDGTPDFKQLHLLVRRTGPRVPADWLSCEVDHFVPEDIPLEPEANRRWHLRMRLYLGLAAIDPAVPDGIRRGFYDFWSRHAGGEVPAPIEVDRLWDYVVATNRRIDRHTSMQRLAREEQAWMEQLWKTGDLPDEELDSPGPGPVLPGWNSGSETVEPLTTRRRVFQESARMRHCVASYAKAMMEGQVAVFHVSAAGDEATIALEKDPNEALRVVDFRGLSNAAPPGGAVDLVRRWLSACGREPDQVLSSLKARGP